MSVLLGQEPEENVGPPILGLTPSPTMLRPSTLLLLAVKAILGLGLCSLYHFPICSDQRGEEQGLPHAPEMLPRRPGRLQGTYRQTKGPERGKMSLFGRQLSRTLREHGRWLRDRQPLRPVQCSPDP